VPGRDLGLTVTHPGTGVEQIRLLVCGFCKTIQELPDYNGPADRDEVLAYALHKHQAPGHGNSGALMKVDKDKWEQDQIRDMIVKQIRDGMEKGNTGFSPETYNVMNTFRDDAMTCWVRDHNRNPACGDYKSDSKRLSLGPEHAAERKAAGLDPRYDADNPNKTRYLCEWCPVHSLVQQAARTKMGLDA
jgi:hypothetical protein